LTSESKPQEQKEAKQRAFQEIDGGVVCERPANILEGKSFRKGKVTTVDKTCEGPFCEGGGPQKKRGCAGGASEGEPRGHPRETKSKNQIGLPKKGGSMGGVSLDGGGKGRKDERPYVESVVGPGRMRTGKGTAFASTPV